MVNCPRCHVEMKSSLTKSGVMIDSCDRCRGIWLDQGEVNFFLKNKSLIEDFEIHGLRHSVKSSEICPHCTIPLDSGELPNFDITVEECSSCQGLLFDFDELKKVIRLGKAEGIQRDERVTSKEAPLYPNHVKIPSLWMTTLVVLLCMYGGLFLLVKVAAGFEFITEFIGIGCIILVTFLSFIFGPIVMDWSLRFFGSVTWYETDELPEGFLKVIDTLCRENKIPLPRIGIINDGSPQAYTYGRSPYSARIVFSEGLFRILDDDEVEAVLAHELGHIKHWDFLVMTFIQIVPLLLKQLSRSIKKNKDGGKKSKKGTVVDILYVISNYLVLFISRAREYHADRFSCYATKNPNALTRALVKIGFGMTSNEVSAKAKPMSDYSSVQAMGIMNIASSKMLAIAAEGKTNRYVDRKEEIKKAMRWDLWNPWGSYYELNSTHPLIAKRINAIGVHAVDMRLRPEIIFDLRKPESYWDEFLFDFIIVSLPYIGLIGGLFFSYFFQGHSIFNDHISTHMLGILAGISIGGVLKTLFVYGGGNTSNYSISALLKKIKVSPVRPHKVRLFGTVIGRGDSGNIFSEDLVLQDKTGLIFLDHEPLGLNLFFALVDFDKFKGEKVQVEGWYRRAPIPYIEVQRIVSKKKTSRSYTFYLKLIMWIFAPICYYYLERPF